MTETVKVEAVAISVTERVVTTLSNNEVIITGGLLPRSFQETIGGAIGQIDLTDLEDGSMLVYEQNIEKWKAVRKLEKQIMEGGFY